jgi:predicted transcriptional regulator
MTEEDTDQSILKLTTKIVSAHVTNNRIDSEELPEFISCVSQSLRSMIEAHPEPPAPAVPIEKSVGPEYIVCLEDGKKLKTLKWHLRAAHNLSPDEYRAKWGSSADYPMVAPNYSRKRREIAKRIGLGRVAKAKVRT